MKTSVIGIMPQEKIRDTKKYSNTATGEVNPNGRFIR